MDRSDSGRDVPQVAASSAEDPTTATQQRSAAVHDGHDAVRVTRTAQKRLKKPESTLTSNTTVCQLGSERCESPTAPRAIVVGDAAKTEAPATASRNATLSIGVEVSSGRGKRGDHPAAPVGDDELIDDAGRRTVIGSSFASSA